MSLRTVAAIVPTVRTVEGGGFVVRRPFPTEQMSHYDPFLLLDHLGPVDYAPGQAKGAPDHPHRGFETVSYILEGKLLHADSHGHRGILSSGDVQWMTAGDGIVHAEMPDVDFYKNGGRMHGFQIWVNLPKADKRMTPRYQEVPSAGIPVATSADGKVRVKVIAGEAMGVRAVIDTRTPILHQHWTLSAGGSATTPVPEGWNGLVYVISGRGTVSGTSVVEGQMAALSAGDSVTLATDGAFDLLLLAGKPLNEPVARYGPFVMNTKAEIQQAFADYQAGKMGAITAQVS